MGMMLPLGTSESPERMLSLLETTWMKRVFSLMHNGLIILATTMPRKSGTRISNGTLFIHCGILRRMRRLQYTISASTIAVKPAKRPFKKRYAFTCSCRLCSLPLHQSQESDRRLNEILKLDYLIGSNGLMGYCQPLYEYFDTLIKRFVFTMSKGRVMQVCQGHS
jgi:hypothetical protein